MRRPKRDPAKASKLILAYEQELKQLVKRIETESIKALKYSAGVKELEAPIKENLLFESIAAITTAVTVAASTIVAQQVMKSYLQGDNYAKAHVKKMGVPEVEVGISFNLPVASETINHLERRQNVAFKGIADEMNKRIHNEISTGIQSGESVYQIADRISNASQVGYSRAETIARTETMNALNQGSLDRYRKAGFTKVKWLAAEDERTCKRPLEFMGKVYAGCGGLDGKIFDVNEVPPIPFHPNCRCTTIPVMETRENERVLSAVKEHWHGPLFWEGKHPPGCPCEGDYWNDQRI